MIILDEEDHHQVKFDSIVAGSTVRYPEKAVGRASSPLPDYEASEAQHRLSSKNLEPSLKKSRATQILRATFYALAIYVALSAIIVLPIVMTRRKARDPDIPRSPNPTGLWVDSYIIMSPPPSFSSASLIPFSATKLDCSSWQETVNKPLLSQTELQHTFPATGSIAIRSNLSTSDYQTTYGVFGNLTVDTNPDHKATDIIIKLQASASNYTLLQQTNICIYNNDTENGLTIYAPGNLAESQFLSFNVQLLFPRTSSPYIVPDLTTYLPQFSQHFASLSKYVTFKQVSIFGTQFDITCLLMEAPIIGIKNTRAAITGNFNVSSSLILDTIFGAITSNIILTSITQAPTFVLDTGNAAINADIVLAAPSPAPPSFFGRVKTFSAPINLSFKNDAPITLPLQLSVDNNEAPTNVTLDPLYHGQFDIQSKLAPVSVDTSRLPPSSQTQVTYDSQSYERISGCIGDRTRPSSRIPAAGKIQVVSALGPVVLNIGPGSS